MLLWKEALETSPNSGIAYAGLASAYTGKGDIFLSMETARKGISIDPYNYYLRVNLGRSYKLTGDLDSALREYEAAMRIDPNESILLDIGMVYEQKGDLEPAELYIKKAMEVWDKMPQAHYHLGRVLIGRGRAEEGVSELERAVTLDPSYIHARYQLALTLERLGREGEALLQYREILRTGSESALQETQDSEKDKRVVREILKNARQRLSNSEKL